MGLVGPSGCVLVCPVSPDALSLPAKQVDRSNISRRRHGTFGLPARWLEGKLWVSPHHLTCNAAKRAVIKGLATCSLLIRDPEAALVGGLVISCTIFSPLALTRPT